VSKYRYIGECAAGFVQFNRPNKIEEPPVVMPTGKAVEVPDWLATKLADNSHFEEATGSKSKDEKSKDDNPGESETEHETGECPDCGKTVKVRGDGYLYSHKCVGD